MPPRFVHVFVMTQAGSDETGMPSELPVQTLATRKPVSSKAIDVVTATDVPSRRRGSASPSSPRETRRNTDMPGNLLTRRPDRGEPCGRGTFDRLASSWLRAACISAAAPASREKRIRWRPMLLQYCKPARPHHERTVQTLSIESEYRLAPRGRTMYLEAECGAAPCTSSQGLCVASSRGAR